MPNLTDMKAAAYKHIMVYGAPKAGKTLLVGGLAERFNLKWFDLERGVATLFQLPDDWKKRVDVIQIPDTRAAPMAVETMLKVLKGLPCEICHTHGKVACPICRKEGGQFTRICLNEMGPEDCLVIDSITQLVNSTTANITRNQPDDYKLGYDDWAHLGRVMDTVFSYIQAAPYNVVVISHEMEVTVPDGSKEGKYKLVPTGGTRNFSRNSAKYFDEIVFCEVKNKRHTFASSTTYSNAILTGGRSNFHMESSPNAKLLDLWT